MDTMDMDTDMTTGTEVVICIRIRGIHIRVPGGFSVPVSITNVVCHCLTLILSLPMNSLLLSNYFLLYSLLRNCGIAALVISAMRPLKMFLMATTLQELQNLPHHIPSTLAVSHA